MTTLTESPLAQLPIANDPAWREEVELHRIDCEDPDLSALRRDGVAAMELLFDEFVQGEGTRDRALVARVIGRLNEIQVRDFAMGMHTVDNLEAHLVMWGALLRIAPPQSVAPLACITAALAYESENPVLAQLALDRAFEDCDAYPLAQLLRRVFAAGWAPSEFSAMRAELHPKVAANIFDIGESDISC